MNHVRLDHSTLWQVQDLGLRVGLVGELWARPFWASAPTGEHESQGWDWTELVKVAVPVGIHVAGSREWLG